MTDEIKNIKFIEYNGIEGYIDLMKHDVEPLNNPECKEIELYYNGKDIKAVLDYITNLQEENNSLKQMSKDTYDTSQEIIFELQEELKSANDSITWWTNRFNAVQRDYEYYKLRIEKAIEYVNKNDDYFYNYPLINRNDLLNILEGVDKDE